MVLMFWITEYQWLFRSVNLETRGLLVHDTVSVRRLVPTLRRGTCSLHAESVYGGNVGMHEIARNHK